MFQEIKGQERIIKTAREPGILCLSESLGHIQPLGPGKLHQTGIMFNPMGLYREFRQYFQELSLSAAHLDELLSFQIIILYQVPVLVSAQFHHGFGKTARPDYIPVIVHGFAVKLNQSAAHTLAQIQRKPLVIRKPFGIRHMLGTGRHII